MFSCSHGIWQGIAEQPTRRHELIGAWKEATHLNRMLGTLLLLMGLLRQLLLVLLRLSELEAWPLAFVASSTGSVCMSAAYTSC